VWLNQYTGYSGSIENPSLFANVVTLQPYSKIDFLNEEGKAHTCLYKVPQLAVHVRAKTKP
jgi:hypothetical protein